MKKEHVALQELYEGLTNKELYKEKKELRINDIKKMREIPGISQLQRYDLNLRLFDEYKTYMSDSAISYARQNLELALEMKDIDRIPQSKITLSSMYVIAGMYLDAAQILESMDRKKLPEWLLYMYYDAYKQLYRFYATNNFYTKEYEETSKLYRDSLLMVLDVNSTHYKIVLSEKLLEDGKLSESKQIIEPLFNYSMKEDHERAVLAYSLARIAEIEGDTEKEKEYYAISALSDLKNAIMENASMQALASVLYDTNDIDGAYTCIKSSMEDAMFCNARMRTYEVSKIFPIIDSAYQEKIVKQKTMLTTFLTSVSVLTLFLIVAIIYVVKQMKRITRIRKELYQTNLRLNDLNEELKDSNRHLSTTNMDLAEANCIKETYIGHFLDLCASYVDKLERYRKKLSNLAATNKMEELYSIIKSTDMYQEELKELYNNFDNVFLHLYPDFVEEFNTLLLESERFDLKPNELLNPELRIFALIRLGITDSSKIASFLHYSSSTIYNYRTRVRNKASVARDEFEARVAKIGSFAQSDTLH